MVKPKLPQDEIRRRMCTGKHGYDSETHARWGLKDSINSGFFSPTEKFNVYACRFCGKFHVGHAERPVGLDLEQRFSAMIDELTEAMEGPVNALSFQGTTFTGPPNDDLTGLVSGKLTVMEYHQNRGKARWMVRCECGNLEFRTGKALCNPANKNDACTLCKTKKLY